MKPFYLIEHTGDLAMVAQGRDLRELCENAANGMLAMLADVDALAPTLERRVEVSAPTEERLLIDFLKELHFVHETEGIIFAKVEVEECDGGRLLAVARGVPMNEGKEHVLEEIKAVTYHDLRIERYG
ncbi:MAG: archease, partial [Armatimonadota bacterium]